MAIRRHTMSCALLLCLAANTTLADLKIHIDKNRIGFVQAYLENVSDQPVTIVTDKLIYTHQGDKVEITPEQKRWQRRDGETLLKSSLMSYSPVTLAPGEITFLQSPNIRVVTKEVVYSIPADWAVLHGTWQGSVSHTVTAGTR